jgi:hypothetical protein
MKAAGLVLPLGLLVLVGAASAGEKSTPESAADGGETWRLMPGGGAEWCTRAIAVDPANPGAIPPNATPVFEVELLSIA